MLLKNADDIKVGETSADALYAGDKLAWIGAPSADQLPSLAAHYNAERVFGETLLEDDFNRADGAIGSVPGPGDAVAWANGGGTWAISGGTLTRSSTGAAELVTVETGAADCVVTATITLASVSDRIYFRTDGTGSTYLAADFAGGGGALRVFKAGTLLATAGAVVRTAGQTVTLAAACKGDVIRVFVDGVFALEHVLSAGDYTTYGALTKHGVGGSGAPSGGVFEDFSVRTLDPATDLVAASDTFTRADGAVGSTEAGLAPSLAWTGTTNGFLTNGSYRSSSFSLSRVPSGLADVDITLTFTRSSVTAVNGGIVFRFNGSGEYLYYFVTGSGSYAITKFQASTHTQVATAGASVALGQTVALRVIAVGDRVWCYADGALVISYTLTAGEMTSFGTATEHGLYQATHAGTSNVFDNFKVQRPPLVAVWPDLSGKHRHAVQTTTSKQPVLLDDVKNSRAATRFDGVNDFLRRILTSSIAQPNTVALAGAVRTLGVAQSLIDGTSGARNRLHMTSGNKTAHFGGGPQIDGTSNWVASAWRQVTGIFTAPTSKLRVDGVQEVTGDSGSQAMGAVTLGADHTDGTPGAVDIGEIIITSADLSAADHLDVVEEYLTRRWT